MIGRAATSIGHALGLISPEFDQVKAQYFGGGAMSGKTVGITAHMISNEKLEGAVIKAYQRANMSPEQAAEELHFLEGELQKTKSRIQGARSQTSHGAIAGKLFVIERLMKIVNDKMDVSGRAEQ